MSAPLLYFVTPETAALPAYALREDGKIPARRGGVEGPRGDVGALATPCAGIPHLEYLPTQRWVQVKNAPEGTKRWIGVDPALAIVPDMLARETMRTGHPVALGDGHLWEIPVARLALGGSGLPRRRILAEDGSRVWQVEEPYRDLCEFAERLWAVRRGLGGIIADAEIDRFCGAALSVNYRLDADEAAALGLLTDSGIKAILDALLDWPTMLAIFDAQKKTSGIPAS